MKHLQCKVFGHNYEVSRHVTYHVKEYTCKNCGKQLTTNSNGSLTDLTPKFKEINNVLARIHQKRKQRIRLITKNVDKELLLFTH